jgi:hypothetical protein
MKLEDIKKQNIYTVPDKYFDQLPTRIQSRVNDPVSGLHWNRSIIFKLAVPAIAVIVMILYFDRNDSFAPQDAEAILAQVSTEDLIAYIEDMDISTDEIIESIDFSDVELDFYENGTIINDLEIEDESMDLLFDEYGLDEDML